jgi:phage gpG-like protein
MHPVATRIGVFYERSVLKNFKAEQSPDGTPWKRLAADTLLMGLNRRKGFGKKGLNVKGKKYLMHKQVLWEHGDLAGSIHFQADRNSVTIGSGGHIPYAAIHQFGSMDARLKFRLVHIWE